MEKKINTISFKINILSKDKEPFDIPENWFWTDIDSINQYSGSSIDPMKWPETTFELYSVPSSDDDCPEIIIGSEIGSAKQVVIKNDVLLCKINPRINRVWKVFQHTDNQLIASSEWIIIRNVAISPDYLMFCLKTQYFREFMLSNVSGVGGSLMRAQPKYVKSYPIPIAPIAEQQRIVDCIERLFAKLDEAKEKAQVVVDGFELRKSAILHKAFTGELVGISSGRTIPLESIVETIRIGPFGSALHKEDYIMGGIPIVNPKHIINQQIVFEEKVTITEEKASELMAYRVKTGDIIMGRRGEMGRSAPVTEKENGWLCGTGSLIIRLRDGYNSAFYSQIIASHSSVQYLEENCVGSTMKNLNEKVIKKLPVPNYTKEQQKFIVTTLNSLLEKEKQAKEAAECVLDQIDTMKKAILARAFRGELGTNDSTEESAIELLNTVL